MILSKYPLSNKRRFELPMPVLGEKRSVALPSCFKRRVYFLNHEVMKTMKSFIKSFNETMSGRLKRDGSESRFLLAVTTSLCMDTIGFILSKSDLSTGYIDLPNPYLSSLYSYISSMYPFIESMQPYIEPMQTQIPSMYPFTEPMHPYIEEMMPASTAGAPFTAYLMPFKSIMKTD